MERSENSELSANTDASVNGPLDKQRTSAHQAYQTHLLEGRKKTDRW